MFKNMDTNTIKAMTQMQGMNLTDDMINMMKNNITPEMMKMAASVNNTNSNISSINTNNYTDALNNNDSINSNNPSTMNGGLPNMDMSSMMNFIQKNPQIMNMMGPQMSNMFGGANPNIDPNMMMSTMQTIFWIISLPSRIKNFFTSTRGILLIICIITLIYAYFFK